MATKTTKKKTPRKTAVKKTAKKAAVKKAAKKTENAKKNGVKKPARKLRLGQNPHPRKLRGALRHELRAAGLDLEVKRQKLAKVNADLNTLSMDKTYQPVFALMGKRETISNEIKSSVLAFAVVQKKVANKFNIPINKLHEYTFDTDSGAIALSAAVKT